MTNKEPPEAPEEELISEDEDLLLSKYNLEILPMETWDKINTLAVSKEENPECVEVWCSWIYTVLLKRSELIIFLSLSTYTVYGITC